MGCCCCLYSFLPCVSLLTRMGGLCRLRCWRLVSLHGHSHYNLQLWCCSSQLPAAACYDLLTGTKRVSNVEQSRQQVITAEWLCVDIQTTHVDPTTPHSLISHQRVTNVSSNSKIEEHKK